MTRKNKVQVWLRARPSQHFSPDYLTIKNDNKTMVLHTNKDEKIGIVNNQKTNWSYSFDGIYNNSSQQDVFKDVGESIMDSVTHGYNCSILCYGQTGSGKTFTMTGATENFNNRGIVPRFLSKLYRQLSQESDKSVSVKVSYLEIYNEQLFDLLNTLDMEEVDPSHLTITEDDEGVVYVKGLGYHLAQTEEEALNLLFEGEANRATAAHLLNKRSSRSHCIFTVYLETRSRLQSQANYSVSKIQFVDLAGSERLEKTQSAGKIQQEACYINKSLSFLEQTVIALSERNREHVPYRQSKLTHFLKDSLGGRSKTMLIANIWSDSEHMVETISTMRFAQRMMCVASEPVENIKYDYTILIKNLQKENAALRQELSMYDALHNRNHASYEPLSEQQKFEIREQVRRYNEGELGELDVVNLRQVIGVYEAFRHLFRQQKLDYEEKIHALNEAIASTTPPTAGQAVSASPQQPSSQQVKTITTTGSKKASGSQQLPTESTPQTSSVQQASSKVGDIDRNGGFGIGQADKNQLDENGGYLQSRKKDRKSKNAKKEMSSGKEDTIGAEAEYVFDKTIEIPSRSDAFEEFKKENGQSIYKILTENKEILSEKKKEYSDFANAINAIKVEIDTAKVNLETLKKERECQGPSYTSDGEVIITEEEYLEIEKLNNKKKDYREKYDELKNVKSEIFHCQKMVDLTRQQLLKDFDVWYTEAYLDGEQATKESDAELIKKINYEDPIEKFDSVKHSKFADNPDEEAYNRAKESLYHRHIFGAAMNQPQPVRRKPGTPVLLNSPYASLPNQMEIIQP